MKNKVILICFKNEIGHNPNLIISIKVGNHPLIKTLVRFIQDIIFLELLISVNFTMINMRLVKEYIKRDL